MDGLNIKRLEPSPEHPYVRYFLDVRVRVGGQQRRARETLRGSWTEAKSRYLDLRAELRNGGRGARGPAQTFAPLLEQYREARGGVIPVKQARIYNDVLRDLGAVRMEELAYRLQVYAALLRRMPSRKTGKVRAGGTLNRYRAIVAAALNLAVELGQITKSPLNKAVWPKAKEIPRDQDLDHVQVLRLFNAIEADSPWMLPVVRYALQVPCRKSELERMDREDLDLFSNAIRVRNGTTKNEEGTWKPIPPDMIAYFRALPQDCPYLFYRVVKGQYRRLGDFKSAWTRCLALAGIRDFRFHDTRHVSATRMVDAGTPERAVMDVAGWKTNMLSTYYKSSSKKALGLVRFSTGRVHPGYSTGDQEGKSGENGAERAVS